MVVRMSVAVVVAGLLAGCGGQAGGGESSACDPVRRERADPASTLHLLPGATEPEYLSDPPTSGAHRAGPLPDAVLDDPLDRPSQVGVLEQGGVLLQHRGLDDSERAELESLAGDGVVVAPNPDLDEAVVATAWTVKLRCAGVDPDALRDFVDQHLTPVEAVG